MFTNRGLSIVRNKIKKTWDSCGSILAGSIEELAYILNENDFSTFLAYLNRLEQTEQSISLIRRKDGLYCLDYLEWNDRKVKRGKK